jgi:AraC-like DNA-binding protein
VSILPTPHPEVFATYSDGGLQFAKHWHDTYGVGLLDTGAQSWASARGRADAYAGDVIDTNPGEVHDGRPLGAPSRSWRIVSLTPAHLLAATDRTGVVPEIVRPVIHDPELAAALRRLFRSIEGWDSSGRSAWTALAFQESLVESCSLLLTRHGSAKHATPDSGVDMRIVRDALAGSARQAPSLDELAMLARVSKFRVVRHFRKRFGLPPHAWLSCHRAERARTLIRRGVPLATAAAECGFSDQSHMTRVFVRAYGCTPGAWRRSAGPRNEVQDRS